MLIVNVNYLHQERTIIADLQEISYESWFLE
jgi:hypothetical protein